MHTVSLLKGSLSNGSLSPETAPAIAAGPQRAFRASTLLLLAAVAAITAARLVWLAVQPADLYPDEAQYWFWAKHPAFGYYSKPPLVAWLIALTTSAFGDSEFAIRLSAPLLHAIAAGFVYATGARLYDGKVGFWAALVYLTAPGVSLSALCNLDRCRAAAVLGGGALCLCAGARVGRCAAGGSRSESPPVSGCSRNTRWSTG